MEKIVFVVLISFTTTNQFENNTTSQLVEIILNVREPFCAGAIFIFDDFYWIEHSETIHDLTESYPTPVALFHGNNNSILQNLIASQDPEYVCNNVVIFQHHLNDFLAFYRQLEAYSFIKSVIVVTQSSENADAILDIIKNENVLLIIEHSKYLEARVMKIDNRIRQEILNPKSIIKKGNFIVEKTHHLMGRHLKLAILPHYPPAIIRKNVSGNSGPIMDGIDPSIINVLISTLNFTYDYIEAAPLEMWGKVFGEGNNMTATGVMGLLIRKEADMGIADVNIDFVNLLIMYLSN